MTRSRLDGGDWDGHWVLWLTADRILQLVGRYIQLMRAKDDRQLIFHLHENGTKLT